MRMLLPLLLALLCACQTGPSLEAPQILSISPTGQLSSEQQVVIVELDTEPRFFVDYGKKTAQLLEQPMLQIGPQTVRLDTYLGLGHYQGTVAPGLEAGRYDIKVTLGDGREAMLADAYEVKTEAEKPRLGYWIESIGPQLSGQDFTVTIHVDGTNAELYAGTVLVSMYNINSNQTTFIRRSGAFSGGVRQEHIRIDTVGDDYLILVEDDAGHGASSNRFRVDQN